MASCCVQELPGTSGFRRLREPCSPTIPGTWPSSPRPSRRASTTPTLRPGPSPGSECPAFAGCLLPDGQQVSHSPPPPSPQVLLGFPRPLQPRGRAPVPGAGVHLSEGPAVSPAQLGQHRVAAAVGPLVLVLAGEPQVRSPAHCQLSSIRFNDDFFY